MASLRRLPAPNRRSTVSGERLRSHLRVPLYRNAYALSLSALGSAGLGSIFWAVSARVYDRDVVGTSSAAVAALAFVAGVAGLYLDGALYRFLPRAGAASMRLVLIAALVTAVAGAVGAGVFLVGLPIWAPDLSFLRSSPATIAGCVAATVTTSLLVLQDAALTGLRRTTWVPIKNLTYNSLKLPTLVLLAMSAPRYGILLSWIVPGGLVAVGAAFFIHGRAIPAAIRRHRASAQAGRPLPQEPLDRNHVARYAAGNYVGYLCNLSYRTLPPIVVLHAAGSGAAASFYPPWLLATSISLLVTNLSVSLVVEGALERDRLAMHTRQALLQTARLILPAAALLALLAPYLLRIFGDTYAKDGTTLLRLLAIGLIPGAVCIIGFGTARVRDHVRSIIVNQFVIAAITLGLGGALVRPLGLAGVGVAALAAQSIIAVVLTLTELRPTLGEPDRATRGAVSMSRPEMRPSVRSAAP
jgi:O-antigen/teichoic acid export membrane protein